MEPCATFWWEIYKDQPYVHKPDAYEWPMGEHVGPYFCEAYLKDGLSGDSVGHFRGEVDNDSIWVATDGGEVAGFLVTSINREDEIGNIVSGFAHPTGHGRSAMNRLVAAAIDRFKETGLSKAFIAPGSISLEVNSPLYHAPWDHGFGLSESDDSAYYVFLGGSLVGWQMKSHHEWRTFGKQVLRRGDATEARNLELHPDLEIDEGMLEEMSVAAISDGRVIGYAHTSYEKSWTETGPTQRLCGKPTPKIIPEFRGRGLGKVLYHQRLGLAIDKGANCSYTVTEVDNPARHVYQSAPSQTWFTCRGSFQAVVIVVSCRASP
jgi:GNAT superfamily N-acetyltransferase